MGGILEDSILHHVCIVLLLIWLLSSFNCCHTLIYFISFIYLYMVHERYVHRLRRKLRFEERRHSNQRRVLCDSESVRWLNYTVEKIWPVCMEQIVSQKILLPIIPWFLQKYKPWTVKDAVVQHLYMGRSPPMFTGIRVLQQSTGDDHLVMELGMNFRTADDMSAILDVKIAKRLGGMRVNLNLMGLHVEGKVLVGVKFLRHWPFLGRLRVCFVEPPYFQMIVKPLFSHGLDVTELPGIAGWLDNLLAVAFQQTLVQPNMLVVDMEKFVSPQAESWFSVDEKEPIAYAIVEVIEAVDMKPSDLNGLADPYVKGKLGPYEFETKIQRKTLSPKWLEEFKAPIWSWESPVLAVELHDKDHFSDDSLGHCSITIGDLRDDQRHDMWLPLQNIKMGRLHLAITVVEEKRKGADKAKDGEIINKDNERNSIAETSLNGSSLSAGLLEKSPIVTDTYEPIDIEGQEEAGIWVLRPGSEVSQIWKPRKGKNTLPDAQICGEGSDGVGDLKSSASRLCDGDSGSSSDESQEGNKGHKRNKVMRGLQKIGSVFHRHSKKEDTNIRVAEPVPSPHANLKAVNVRECGVKLIVEDNKLSLPSPRPSPVEVLIAEGTESPKGNEQESPNRRNVKDMAKSIFKHRFSCEGSKIISQADLGSEVNGREISVGPESSDEESLPSSVCTSEGIPDVSKPISVLGSDSFKSKGVNDQTSLSDTAMNIEDPINKVSLEGLQKIGDGPLFSSEGNDDLLVKESDPKQPEENLESR